jgi:hypothetical protein
VKVENRQSKIIYYVQAKAAGRGVGLFNPDYLVSKHLVYPFWFMGINDAPLRRI